MFPEPGQVHAQVVLCKPHAHDAGADDPGAVPAGEAHLHGGLARRGRGVHPAAFSQPRQDAHVSEDGAQGVCNTRHPYIIIIFLYNMYYLSAADLTFKRESVVRNY